MAKASSATPEPGDLRERILAASVTLLEEQGISGLSLREVARRAGVSHQAPYHHFADREAILAAILHDGFRILGESILGIVGAAKLKKPSKIVVRDAVTAVLVAYVRFAWEHPGHFGLMFRPEICNVERYPAAEDQAQMALASLHELVAFAVKKHPAWQDRQSELAATFWSMAHGYATLAGKGTMCQLQLGGAAPEDHLRDVTQLVGVMVSCVLEREPPERQNA